MAEFFNLEYQPFVQAGINAVVVPSYAGIFLRRGAATGELYPWKSVGEQFKTGQDVFIDFERNLS